MNRCDFCEAELDPRDGAMCDQCAEAWLALNTIPGAEQQARCDRCDEYIEEQFCTHGRDLCPDHLWHCGDCQTEFAESRAYDDERDS